LGTKKGLGLIWGFFQKGFFNWEILRGFPLFRRGPFKEPLEKRVFPLVSVGPKKDLRNQNWLRKPRLRGVKRKKTWFGWPGRLKKGLEG